ncbi:MAG: hypothetical protein ACJATT_000990 [Myxococcota bacterium]
MTDPISLTLAGTAAVVALVAGWFSLPGSPEVSEERWFKACLATLWMGVVEARGGDLDAWETEVVHGVPFHPWVGSVERWLTADIHTLPSTEAGSAALLGALREQPSAHDRYQSLFHHDHTGRQARLSDPSDLGAAYDPSRLLGKGIGWDAVRDWGADEGAKLATALARAVPATWVVVGHDGRAPGVLDALVGLGAERAFEQENLSIELLEHAPTAADRLIVVATADSVAAVLRGLVERPDLRDRVLAVLSIGGDCQGPRHTDWMGAHFTDEQMDLEAHRPLLFLALQWLDPALTPPGFDGLDVAHARFPVPERSGPQDRVVHAVDLGVLPPVSPVSTTAIAKALQLVTGLLILSGRAAG